jgi:glycerol uptake facilitator-like aquaporin
VPIYIFAQIMGGICGAGCIYANYIHAIDLVEGGRNIRTLTTAGLFSTYAVRMVHLLWRFLYLIVRFSGGLSNERIVLF